jgi:hypothetical protein
MIAILGCGNSNSRMIATIGADWKANAKLLRATITWACKFCNSAVVGFSRSPLDSTIPPHVQYVLEKKLAGFSNILLSSLWKSLIST